jgi:hypothetical protein
MTRWALRAGVLVALIFASRHMIDAITAWFNLSLMPNSESWLNSAVLIGTGAYVGLLAIPFVPGAEIGFALLMLKGGEIAPLIYLATAGSLTLAYLIGRHLPPKILQKSLRALGLERAAAFVGEAAQMSDDDLQAKVAELTTSRFLKGFLRYRYVALAFAVNMPGNVVLGGGGGIAMMAGLSRLYAPLPFLLTILLAVLPVPLLFYLGHL